MEGHWLESQNSFAGLVHRFNFILEPSGRAYRAKLTLRIDHHRHGIHNPGCRPVNAGDKSSGLVSFLADADGVGLKANTWVADIDITAAADEVKTGGDAHPDVVAARDGVQ